MAMAQKCVFCRKNTRSLPIGGVAVCYRSACRQRLREMSVEPAKCGHCKQALPIREGRNGRRRSYCDERCRQLHAQEKRAKWAKREKCRWCGAKLVHGKTRPRLYCDDGCRRQGAAQLAEARASVLPSGPLVRETATPNPRSTPCTRSSAGPRKTPAAPTGASASPTP